LDSVVVVLQHPHVIPVLHAHVVIRIVESGIGDGRFCMGDVGGTVQVIRGGFLNHQLIGGGRGESFLLTLPLGEQRVQHLVNGIIDDLVFDDKVILSVPKETAGIRERGCLLVLAVTFGKGSQVACVIDTRCR
jgi:hypothetical protein